MRFRFGTDEEANLVHEAEQRLTDEQVSASLERWNHWADRVPGRTRGAYVQRWHHGTSALVFAADDRCIGSYRINRHGELALATFHDGWGDVIR
jgi:hypothetical protein